MTVLRDWVPGMVATPAWLLARGVSYDLARAYVRSGWLERVATGVYQRPGEVLTWAGAMHSLQEQQGLAVHVGATTALAADGVVQYARPGGAPVFLFGAPGVKPPGWFRGREWPEPVTFVQSALLPAGAAVRAATIGGFPVRASAPERAVLEGLDLAPGAIDLVEMAELIEGLRTLRPETMQSMLAACSSIKVRRLFLYLAERAGLPVLARLRREELDLGSGDRTVTPGGVYVARYGLVVPRELAGA